MPCACGDHRVDKVRRRRLRPQQPLARRGGMAPPRRRRCPPGPGRRSATFCG